MGMHISRGKTPPPVAAEDHQQKPKLHRANSVLCRAKSTGKKYACKSISKKKLVTESEKEDLKREVRIMYHLRGHKNVVELRDTYEDNHCVHLVMELCEGGELYDKMISKGRYSEKLAAQIFSSIMRVVYALHFMGVMHRDLKPENFLLPKKGKPNQEKVGTAFYVAPEVLRRQGYGKEIDIWSAGVILYMLLTGVPPFYAENEKGIFDAILKAEKTLDLERYPWPWISKNAKELVKKMLKVDPKERPTAAEVLRMFPSFMQCIIDMREN